MVVSTHLVAFLAAFLASALLVASPVAAAALLVQRLHLPPVYDSLTFLLDGEHWATIPFGERVIEPVPCTPFNMSITESNGTVNQQLNIFSDEFVRLAWGVYRGVHGVDVGTGFSVIRVRPVPLEHGALLVELHGGDSPYSGNTVLEASDSEFQVFELEDYAGEDYHRLEVLNEDNTEFSITLFLRDFDSQSGYNGRTQIWKKSVVATGAETLTVVYVYGYSDEGPLGPGVAEPMMKVYEDEVWTNTADSASGVVAPVIPWL
ncbi:hypothetical protein QOT17_022724 [Balamuthia mandrillaris]